ncbi:ring finger protein-like [Leptodactylus fuscus]|uniref:ring finger protein-like n=1 Tax=Leptodactylus fuscus TaxID=238119 RepID=UPI003F4F2D4A
MVESRATCGDLKTVEGPKPSPQDLDKMTQVTIVTCDDIHGAKLSKKAADQSFELVEDLHKVDHVPARTSHDGLQEVVEGDLLNNPCKIDPESLSVNTCISNLNYNVIIPEDTMEEYPTIGDLGQHRSSQSVDESDILYGLPRISSTSGGSQVGGQEKNLEGSEAMEPEEALKLLVEEDHPEQECPICTELYDTTKHKQSLLNCNHVFCDNCVKTMVNTANQANLCRVTCPICRQTTPMVEWEVRKMQEQMMESGGVCTQPEYMPLQPLVRRPGLCGALEYRFHKRFRTGRLCLFPPCFRNPQRLMNQLTRLEHRCRCMYLVALLFFLFAEFFCLTFLFLPILVFILMIVLGK